MAGKWQAKGGLLQKEQAVQECDATMFHSHTIAGFIKKAKVHGCESKDFYRYYSSNNAIMAKTSIIYKAVGISVFLPVAIFKIVQLKKPQIIPCVIE